MVTRSTILILSGWLVAMATGRMLPEGAEVYALLAGLGGTLGYLGLTTADRHRRRILAARRSDDAAHKLERERDEIERLNRHAVSRRSSPVA